MSQRVILVRQIMQVCPNLAEESLSQLNSTYVQPMYYILNNLEAASSALLKLVLSWGLLHP